MSQLTFGSLFAGIGGFDLGMDRASMNCVFQVERDRDCNRILDRHWPGRKVYRDVCEFNAASVSVRPDLICGGFPCQDLSVAGKRAGLDGERSGLWFEFKRIIGEFSPRWVLIENVPGLLSSDDGRDFGTVLGGLAELGYGFAYRILDSQWFGVPQRRRRVFIVGCLGDWRRAAEILFERDRLPWDSPPSREAGQDIAPCVRGGTDSGSNESANKVPGRWWDGSDQAQCLDSSVIGKQQMMPDKGRFAAVTHALTGEGFDASEDGTGRGTPLVPVPYMVHGENSCAMQGNGSARVAEPVDTSRCLDTTGGFTQQQGGNVVAYTLHGSDGCAEIASETDIASALRGRAPGTIENSTTTVALSEREFEELERGLKERGLTMDTVIAAFEGTGHPAPDKCYAFQTRIARNGRGQPKEITDALTSCAGGTHADSKPHVTTRMGIRRLTPRECERLQGFPDDWTRFDAAGKELSDSARYRMLGNAVSVPVAAWLARRIVEQCK